MAVTEEAPLGGRGERMPGPPRPLPPPGRGEGNAQKKKKRKNERSFGNCGGVGGGQEAARVLQHRWPSLRPRSRRCFHAELMREAPCSSRKQRCLHHSFTFKLHVLCFRLIFQLFMLFLDELIIAPSVLELPLMHHCPPAPVGEFHCFDTIS